MKRMVSGINSIPAATTRNIGRLKAAQDATTTRLTSDSTGMLGNGDPDHITFLTAAFKSLQMFQTGNNQGVVGTLALLPRAEHASLEDPYYYPSTPFVLDRAGSGPFGFNIARAGTPPAGYYAGDKVIIQKRFKIFHYGDENDPAIPWFIYKITVRSEPKGYVLQSDERYDGQFYSGNPNTGVEPPFSPSLPTDDDGQYLYNDSPLVDSGWSGVTHTIVSNFETKPTITAITPNTYTLPDVGGVNLTLSGTNFLGSSFIMIGPFLPANFDSSPIPDDTTAEITLPSGIVPGVYDVYIVGADGQLGLLENGFTVYAEGGP